MGCCFDFDSYCFDVVFCCIVFAPLLCLFRCLSVETDFVFLNVSYAFFRLHPVKPFALRIFLLGCRLCGFLGSIIFISSFFLFRMIVCVRQVGFEC